MDFITLDVNSVTVAPVASIEDILPHISEALSNHNDGESSPHTPSALALSDSSDHLHYLWRLPPDALVPTPDAALMLGQSPRTLEGWRRSHSKGQGNQGPAFVRSGQSVRYKVRAIRDYLDNREVGTG